MQRFDRQSQHSAGREEHLLLLRICRKLIVTLAGIVGCLVANGQSATRTGSIIVHSEMPGPVISTDIFGQFAEQLGNGIYNGVWVGKDSQIPNVRGIRTDVVHGLRRADRE